MPNNPMLMNFVNALFPNGFSDEVEEYGVIFFNNNEGKGARKVNLTENMGTEILDLSQSLNANEVILVHSQPSANLDDYPVQNDVDLFDTLEPQLTANGIKIYNNTVISKLSGAWECTSFKDTGQPGNFK